MDKIDNQLFELQIACNKYKDIDPLADYILYALSRYIRTDRATKVFIQQFVDYDKDNFEHLIKTCLNGDRSDDGIIKTCKKVFNKKRG